MTPRLIGLIGGMSWQSTAEYYRLANLEVAERLGGLHSARCVIVSVDFAEIEPLQVAGQWDLAAGLLVDAARSLEAAGAELIGLCTNTMHIVADQIEAAIGVPLLHLVDVAARAVTDAGITTVGLLGTAVTMREPFYRERLERHGLEVVLPSEADQAEVHRIIYDELVRGVLREPSREIYRDVIGRLVDAGAQGVILGCTEIELLVGAADSAVPVFATTQLHVRAAVDASLKP